MFAISSPAFGSHENAHFAKIGRHPFSPAFAENERLVNRHYHFISFGEHNFWRVAVSGLECHLKCENKQVNSVR